MRRKWLWRIFWLVVCIGIAIFIVFDVLRVGGVSLPPREPVTVVTLPQNWDPGWDVGKADWFHHASQGTRILKYTWFTALEQPEITVFTSPGRFSDPAYLERFGFLTSEPNDRQNPANLPVGFAIDRDFQEPFSEPASDDDPSAPQFLKPSYAVVGLTCAACHTGQINFRGKGIRIEGGPGMVNLGLFKDAMGRALLYTNVFPTRFRRFARNVLGDDFNDQSKVDGLRAELNTLVEAGAADREYERNQHLYDLAGGFGRTDALGLIANRAFKDFNVRDNLAVADAPVSFPPIWDAPWLDWVQYNASIRLPMVRNIGEVLGVGGLVNISPARGRRWLSTVNIENLHRMETQIAGPKPLNGLRSPKWPKEILGDFDTVRLARGKELYDQRCNHCHATIEELEKGLTTSPPDDRLWHVPDPEIAASYPGQGVFIRLPIINIDRIGTDPAQALNLYQRVVHTDTAMLTSAKEILDVVTGQIRDQKYEELGLDDSQKLAFDGYRKEVLDNPNEQDDREALIPRLAYKARPLNGVWATAPYLHNGSVPNLYEMLVPVTERTKRFYVGSREFDRDRVGIVVDRSSSGFEFDTSLEGNRNIGHEFRNLTLEELERNLRLTHPDALTQPSDTQRWAAVLGVSMAQFNDLTSEQLWQRTRDASAGALRAGFWTKGVLGAELTDEERKSLVEYLKSL